jgi:hypothetical protein
MSMQALLSVYLLASTECEFVVRSPGVTRGNAPAHPLVRDMALYIPQSSVVSEGTDSGIDFDKRRPHRVCQLIKSIIQNWQLTRNILTLRKIGELY